LFQVWRLEGGMADSSRLDHDWLPYRNSNGAAGHWSPPLSATPYRRSPAGATLPRRRDLAKASQLEQTARREQMHMAGYKLATYQTPDGPRAGLVIDDKVFDAAKLTGKAAYASVLAILADWRAAQGALKKAAAAAGKSRVKALPVSRAKLLAPVRWPS